MYNCNMHEALSGAFILCFFVYMCVSIHMHVIYAFVHMLYVCLCVQVCSSTQTYVGDRVCYQDAFLNVSPPCMRSLISPETHCFSQTSQLASPLGSTCFLAFSMSVRDPIQVPMITQLALQPLSHLPSSLCHLLK